MPKRPLLPLALIALVAAACGPATYEIRGTTRMPGVDGTITVGDATGTNRMVTVELQHLAPPVRLQSGHAYYGVWFRDANGRTIFAGHLEYDEGERQGRLVATTPLHTFEVLVTVEQREHPQGPSEHVVIRRRVS